jgi:hypothetical protein
MKTHDVASALELLARFLRQAPNEELSSTALGSLKRAKPDSASIPVALSTLVALSRVERQQWQAVIQEYGFPIVVRPRDASRDILGKLLNYLEQNPEAIKRLRLSPPSSRSDISPELMSALQHLLK